MPEHEDCPHCSGTGEGLSYGQHVCVHCNGTGEYTDADELACSYADWKRDQR